MTYSSIRAKRLTTTLGCSLSLVQQVWQRLHLDINEDPNELIELKAIVKQYRSLVQSTDRISAKVDGLWMSLGIKWSEESLLAKFGIDPSSKKSVDTNF